MDSPSIPLDLYYDVTAPDYVKVYSTTVPGGLPTNTVTPTVSEMKFNTYRLDSAVDFDKRYAAKSRMDVIGKTFTRIAQEILLRQEDTSANLILGSLADAQTNGQDHLIAANGANLILDDFNKLLTLAKRINTAWTGGAPEGGRTKGVTDLIMSPEAVEGLRAMAYNPINTVAWTWKLVMLFQQPTKCATLFTVTEEFLNSTELASWKSMSLELLMVPLKNSLLPGMHLALVLTAIWLSVLTVAVNLCSALLLLMQKADPSLAFLLTTNTAFVNKKLDTTVPWKRVA